MGILGMVLEDICPGYVLIVYVRKSFAMLWKFTTNRINDDGDWFAENIVKSLLYTYHTAKNITSTYYQGIISFLDRQNVAVLHEVVIT